jgi:hypothetical protein
MSAAGRLVVPEAAAAAAGVSVQCKQQGGSDEDERESAGRARSQIMIGHGRLVIESSPARDATPTLLAKGERVRRTARRGASAGRRNGQDPERLTISVRAAFSAFAAQARPRRQVRS